MNSICITESADERNIPMCNEILGILCAAYPQHDWAVRIDGGLLIIKNLRISNNYGMVRQFDDIAHDAGRRKREVIMAAGEFLEAANLVRGKHREGEYAMTLEGRDKGTTFKPLIQARIPEDRIKLLTEETT